MKIVADTSAFMAILLKEDDGGRYRQAMFTADQVIVSAATAVEIHIVVTARLGAEGVLLLNRLLAQPLFGIIAVDAEQVFHAGQGYERFGKGRHPAQLNFGDLFAYALAKSRDLPLLFKGDDFSKTDIEPYFKASDLK